MVLKRLDSRAKAINQLNRFKIFVASNRFQISSSMNRLIDLIDENISCVESIQNLIINELINQNQLIIRVVSMLWGLREYVLKILYKYSRLLSVCWNNYSN